MTFYDIIYKWVADNFGQSEADDPSWNIKELADHLSKSDINPDELNASTKWLVYDKLREWNLEQDIDQVASDKGVELTKGDIETIKHRYYKLDDETWEQLNMIIGDIKYERDKQGETTKEKGE